MSRVTNLLLHTGHRDSGLLSKLEEVNRFFLEQAKVGLVSMDDPSLPEAWYGGSKFLEANLYVGAFNFLDLQAFIIHLHSIKWKEPAAVQLIVKEQEDDVFRIISVFDAGQEGA